MTESVTTAPATNSSELINAIANAMGAIGSVKKDGQNSHFNYKYATISDVLAKVQPLMAQHGLVVFQSEVERALMCEGAIMSITYDFIVAHKSGTTIGPIRQVGLSTFANSKGYDDKAANKCHTAARKYFLLALFQIPTGDYDDADGDPAAPVLPKVAAPKLVPAPTEPPHDPATGELSPHAIAMDSKTPVQWGQQFIAAIDSAKARNELAEWVTMNADHVAFINTHTPKVGLRIQARVNERAVFLGALPDQKPAPVQSDTTAFLTDLDEGMKLARTNKGIQTIIKNNQPLIDALAGPDQAAYEKIVAHHMLRTTPNALAA